MSQGRINIRKGTKYSTAINKIVHGIHEAILNNTKDFKLKRRFVVDWDDHEYDKDRSGL